LHIQGKGARADAPSLDAAVESRLRWVVEELVERLGSRQPEPEFTRSMNVAATSIGMTVDIFKKHCQHAPRHRYADRGSVYHLPTLRDWALAGFPYGWEDGRPADDTTRSGQQRRGSR
jgi:hypothetical protein